MSPMFPNTSPEQRVSYYQGFAPQGIQVHELGMTLPINPIINHHTSHNVAQRHGAPYHHQRSLHHPYAGFDPKPSRELNPPPNASSPPPPLPSSSPPSSTLQHQIMLPNPNPAPASRLDEHHPRHVSRTACLSCRSAKRKCDGTKPVCGPCVLRGVQQGLSQEEGGCVYVASKRGGPRFKGIKGFEATRKRLDEREKLGKMKTPKTSSSMADPNQRPGDAANPTFSEMASIPFPMSSAATLDQFANVRSHVSNETGQFSPFSPSNSSSSRSDKDKACETNHSNEPEATNFDNQSASVFSAGKERESLSQRDYFRTSANPGGGLFDDLSAINLEMWQKIQGSHVSPGISLSHFYYKLENLPKAGVLSMSSVDEYGIVDVDMPNALREIERASKSSAAVNSEQQARALLSDYYELVYPGCPVLLPSGHLSSLAFHLSEDDSSALLAAISSCVALQLPQAEAKRIVRGSLHWHDEDDVEARAGLLDLEHASRQEIALFHAKSAERLLLKKVAQLARGNSHLSEASRSDPNGQCGIVPSKIASPDLELVRIKLVATHTLLSHYHYGMSDQRRAFHHATQAWNHAQALSLDICETVAPTPSWFSLAQKREWARRAYWSSYTAATVMSCTGGFAPLIVTRNSPSDLGLLPNPEGDHSNWKVLVRGAQFVSRAYSALYQLDNFKNHAANVLAEGASQSREHQRRWEAIFDRMQHVDSEIMHYTRNDRIWSDDESCFSPGVGLSRRTSLFEEENETRLNRSLRVAGKLMASGALIILHRAQAFANARIFVAPTCGIPGACDEMDRESNGNSSGSEGQPGDRERGKHTSDRLWHRDAEGVPYSGKRDANQGTVETSHALTPAAVAAKAHSQASRMRSSSNSSHSSASSGSAAARLRDVPILNCGIPVHFSGGPFEPAHALERCRFAASVMYAQLAHISESTFRHGRRESTSMFPAEETPHHAADNGGELWSAPCLPPFSACSLVLAAYVLLMETLHAQIAAGAQEGTDCTSLLEDEADPNTLQLPRILQSDPRQRSHIPQLVGKKAYQLAVRLRQCIKDIEAALEKFARAWETSKGYSQEVRLLLEVNNSLFNGSQSSSSSATTTNVQSVSVSSAVGLVAPLTATTSDLLNPPLLSALPAAPPLASMEE